MTRRIGPAAALAAMLLLGSCGRPRTLAVAHGWVRLAANPGAPGAAYFTVVGGPAPDVLVGVSAAFATRAEMHETMAIGGAAGGHGMTGMAPLARVPVPAGKDVVFAPGGRHVMLFGIKPDVRSPSSHAMTFTFASGKVIEGFVNVVGPGDPPSPT